MKTALFAALAALILVGCGERPSPIISGPQATADGATFFGEGEGRESDPPATTTPYVWPGHQRYPRSKAARNRALRWLSRNQEPDGHWDSAKHGGALDKDTHHMSDYDVAVTALALFALEAEGHIPGQNRAPEFERAYQKAVQWFRDNQRDDGSWAALNYAQTISAAAMAEHYGMTGEDQDMAQKAIDCVISRQHPQMGGWGYGPVGNRTDTPNSGWGLMALQSAKIAGLRLPDEAFPRARTYFANIWGDGNSAPRGRVIYSITNGRPDPDDTPGSTSPAGLAIPATAYDFLINDRDNPWRTGVRDRISEQGPAISSLHGLFWAHLVMYNSGAQAWEPFYETMCARMLEAQIGDGDDAGAWDHAHFRYGHIGGRVYTTAMGVLCLSVR